MFSCGCGVGVVWEAFGEVPRGRATPNCIDHFRRAGPRRGARTTVYHSTLGSFASDALLPYFYPTPTPTPWRGAESGRVSAYTTRYPAPGKTPPVNAGKHRRVSQTGGRPGVCGAHPGYHGRGARPQVRRSL